MHARARRRPRLSDGGAAGYVIASRLDWRSARSVRSRARTRRSVPRRPVLSGRGSANGLTVRSSTRRRTTRTKASKSWSAQSPRVGRRIYAATEEDGTRVHDASTTRRARRGPQRTDRVWRSRALVVESSGWPSGHRGRAVRGHSGASSARRMPVDRLALTGRASAFVDEDRLVRTACVIGPSRQNTSGSTRTL